MIKWFFFKKKKKEMKTKMNANKITHQILDEHKTLVHLKISN